MRIHKLSSLPFSLIIIALFAFTPLSARAETNLGIIQAVGGLGGALLNWAAPKIADTQCIPAIPTTKCGCGTREDSKGNCTIPNKFGCTCTDPRGVNGICTNTDVCTGKSFTNEKGQSGQGAGLDQVAKALGDLFGKLMQGGGGQPSSPPPPPSTFPTGGTGCQGSYFQTSDISQISNPCAQYTPAVSTDITTDTGSCSTLNELLGLCTNNPNNCPSVPAAECAPGSHPVSGGQDANGCVLRDTCVPDTAVAATSSAASTTTGPVVFPQAPGVFIVPPGGMRGDIINSGMNGATIIGGSRDTQGNVEVAGFYGSETFGGQSQGLVGAWCKDRPWATNFLSKIITPAFFDNLCAARGYQVGTPPAAPAVVLQQTPKPKPPVAATTTPATTTPGVPPKVDIWAVPASVPLGGRTSIFWNTQGVTNCTETSPNGGFNQNSLSGGAATQPITAATTFSISCLAPDGSAVTGSVTVHLKI